MKFYEYIYVWIYENGAEELISRVLSGRFFLADTTSKGDDVKNKRKVSPFSSFTCLSFFLSLPSFL